MRKSNSNAVLDFAQKDVGKEETFRVLTASLPLGLSDLVHWLRPKPAELAPFLSGANNSAIGASDPAAVAACGCARRLRHVPGGIVSNSSGAPAATSSDSHARLRRRPNRCEFFPGGTHCGGGAGIPPDYRRFVAVGKWMV